MIQKAWDCFNFHYAILNVTYKVIKKLAIAMPQRDRRSRDCISILNGSQGDKLK